MATYKVIQDIEAEDKLVGPLSLRQFIYGAIAALCAYLSFIALTKGAAFLLIIFAPVMLFTGFFAAPFGRDQPTEVWALAKIRFFVKPRLRIWDQSGMKDFVNITVPKQVAKVYTDNLSQSEVHSRLRALASTLDTRGWVIKNVNANLYDPARSSMPADSDRLIDPASMPQEVPLVDILASDDILDEINNPLAQKLDQLVAASSSVHRQQIMAQLNKSRAAVTSSSSPQLPQPADYWFLNSPLNLPGISSKNTTVLTPSVVVPGSEETDTSGQNEQPTPTEEMLAKQLKANRHNLQEINYQHMKVIQPIGNQIMTPISATPSQSAKSGQVTPLPDPAKISLARNNDLNIATIGRIVNKQDERSDEVVISLHDHTS